MVLLRSIPAPLDKMTLIFTVYSAKTNEMKDHRRPQTVYLVWWYGTSQSDLLVAVYTMKITRQHTPKRENVTTSVQYSSQ